MKRSPSCGHSACRQHYIDSGQTHCIRRVGRRHWRYVGEAGFWLAMLAGSLLGVRGAWGDGDGLLGVAFASVAICAGSFMRGAWRKSDRRWH